jgi:hypothetical protein
LGALSPTNEKFMTTEWSGKIAKGKRSYSAPELKLK